MRRSRIFMDLFLLFLWSGSYSQDFSFTAPKAEFDGYKLTLTYDFKNNNQTDLFFIWVEIRKQDGSAVRANTFKGDVGDSISAGRDKKITWIPEDDAVYLDEDVNIELKAEKYVRAFNKSSMLLASTALPGLGQTKISKGKPYWLTGVVAYGALAGGVIMYSNYGKTYDSYQLEQDEVERQDLYDKSQQEKKVSTALLVSAGVIWVGNLIWVAATPNNYKPLQHSKYSFNAAPSDLKGITILSFRYNF